MASDFTTLAIHLLKKRLTMLWASPMINGKQ
jgi:hypothetical protein